ncbi:MAG: ATP-binding protein, partial [Lachnospiraceae bacterium]|nr:ATP-binding protein [Lachnospiraceae bacterium]
KTRKKDRENHGLGLINVRETVKKNGWSFELTGDGKVVTARVTLRIKTEPFTELQDRLRSLCRNL